MSPFSEEKRRIAHSNPVLPGVTFYRSVFFALLALAAFRPAEKLFAQRETVKLDTVLVRGFSPEKFMSGLKVQRIDSATLSVFLFQNIGEMLAQQTPIAFKNYGPGQLSTVAFRGTSANHTAVLWNGLNINSPMLGQTDFSTIPVAGIDQLSIQYGSAASIAGSDAVGGSILINSQRTRQRINAFSSQNLDHFLNYQIQQGARYSSANGLFSGKTVANVNMLNNHYWQTIRNGVPLFPSRTQQYGLMQDLFFNLKKEQELSAHVWVTNNRLVLTPDEVLGKELTQSEAYRAMVRYHWRGWTVRTAWVRDVIDYAKGDFTNPDHSVSDKFANRAERDLNLLSGRLFIKTGAEWTHYRAKVPGYKENVITENRTDIFALSRWQATSRLLFSVNLRQAFVIGYQVPFTPSAGLEYQFVKTNNYSLTARGSVARSYRVPTLNERYWKDLGNPDIQPEHGWNKEAGIEQRFQPTTGQRWRLSVTAYHNRIKNWTYWNPSKNYRVENLQQVLTQGVELQAGWHGSEGRLQYGIDGGYARNQSQQEKAYDAYARDIVGKQLVFVPLHSGNVTAFTQLKSTRLTIQGQAVSRRYSTFDNTQFLDGYGLMHVSVEQGFNLNMIRMHTRFQVNNVTNAFYLNVRNFAMPGRSFALSVLFNFQS